MLSLIHARLITAALLAVALAGPAAAQGFPADSTVRAILAERVATRRTPGIVVGLLDGTGRRVLAAGRADSAARVPLDGRTVFEIGSVTKVFTATVLADMVARGVVRLDQPVAELLPADARVPSRGGRAITLRELVTHTSALPRMPNNFSPADPANPYADYSVRQLYAFLSSYELPRDVGEAYEYSNLGMGLLGHALARRAGTTYEALLTARVLSPLAMHDTRITLTPDLRSRLATGHDAMGNPTANWDIPTLAGAGALRSTADDMLTWIAANLAPPEGPPGRAIRDTHAPTIATGNEGMDIALGWHVARRPNATIIWHNGGTGGYHSFVGFDAARGMGVVVLANSSMSIDDIAIHLLDSTFALQTPEPIRRRTEIAVAPRVLERYVGEYELAPGFTITVTRDGNQLFIQATNQPKFPAFAESEADFFLKVVDAQISFVRDDEGTVTGLVLHQGGATVPGRRIR